MELIQIELFFCTLEIKIEKMHNFGKTKLRIPFINCQKLINFTYLFTGMTIFSIIKSVDLELRLTSGCRLLLRITTLLNWSNMFEMRINNLQVS